jgi:hypothetical protein
LSTFVNNSLLEIISEASNSIIAYCIKLELTDADHVSLIPPTPSRSVKPNVRSALISFSTNLNFILSRGSSHASIAFIINCFSGSVKFFTTSFVSLLDVVLSSLEGKLNVISLGEEVTCHLTSK